MRTLHAVILASLLHKASHFRHMAGAEDSTRTAPAWTYARWCSLTYLLSALMFLACNITGISLDVLPASCMHKRAGSSYHHFDSCEIEIALLSQ